MTFARALRRSPLLALVLATLCALAPVAPASALTVKLGPEIVVRPLQDVRLQTGRGDPLVLAYKLTFHWLGLPYSMSSDGLVLGVKGGTDHFALDSNRLAQWQAQGHLPTPLPSYRPGIEDYVLGHLLWIVLALVAAWFGRSIVSTRRSRTKPQSADIGQASATFIEPLVRASRLPRIKPRATAEPSRAPSAHPSLPQDRHSTRRVESPARAEPAPTADVRHMASTAATVELGQLPVARTICRVKALKAA